MSHLSGCVSRGNRRLGTEEGKCGNGRHSLSLLVSREKIGSMERSITSRVTTRIAWGLVAQLVTPAERLVQ